MWQVEELLGARARNRGRTKEKVTVTIYERFEIEGRRYSLRSYSKGGQIKRPKS